MELQYAFDPDSSFQRKLNKIFEATGDLTTPLTLIAREWFQGNKSIFDKSRQGPGRYEDLSERYKKQKLKKYKRIYPVLFASGKLAKSITDPKDAYSINLIINKKELVLGTKVPYGIYHQSQQSGEIVNGNQRLSRSKMPYRPFLFIGVEQIAPNDIQNKRLQNWMKILDSYFTQVME